MLPRCPKTPPRRPQDAPRRPKTPQGRPKTAPRPCQDGSKTPPDAPRRLQVGPQRRAKAPKTPPDPRKTETQKRSEAQSIPDLVFRRFLSGFWSVFGWIWEGFGDDFGSSEVDFSRILGASPKPQETTRLHRKNSMPSASAASERASGASEASGAIEVFERIFFRIFGEIHGNHRKEHDTQEKRK